MTIPHWPIGSGAPADLDPRSRDAVPDGPARPDEPRTDPVPTDDWQATGHQGVDSAVRAVLAVRDQPPAEQVAAYQAAHRTLRETLASIDEEA